MFPVAVDTNHLENMAFTQIGKHYTIMDCFGGMHHKLSGLGRVIARGRLCPRAITLLRPDNS
jgi:hypothetical protein